MMILIMTITLIINNNNNMLVLFLTKSINSFLAIRINDNIRNKNVLKKKKKLKMTLFNAYNYMNNTILFLSILDIAVIIMPLLFGPYE